VAVLPPDVGVSEWDCALEAAPGQDVSSRHPVFPAKFKLPPAPHGRRLALRLGLRQIDGFRDAWAKRLVAARADAPFASIDDLRTRADLPGAALDHLAAADALGALKLSRREGLWAARGLPRASPAPLFAAAGLDEGDGRPPRALPRPDPSQEVVSDYETIRLSLKGHPVGFLRERLAARGAVTAKAYEALPDGRTVTVGGVVLVRQRPGKGNVTFLTLEDETGVANVVLWHDLFLKYRPVVMGARLLLVKGRVQKAEGVSHLIGMHLEDISGDLATLSQPGALKSFRLAGDGPKGSPDPREDRPAAVRHRHPRDVRVLPRSRDFH
jgi:error-prone DNA polymerase